MPMTASSMPASAAPVEEAVEERDRGLAALEGEALVADVLRVEELLEALGLDELARGSGAGPRVESVARLRADSMRSMSHCFCAGSWMFMNSAPIFPQ